MLCEAANAGGDYWPSSIARFQVDGDSFELTLNALDQERLIRNCTRVNISGEYTRLRWLFTPNFGFSIARHRTAMAYLRERKAANLGILVGEMGANLEQKEDQPCHFISRALLMSNEGSQQVVWSYYHGSP